MTVVENKEKTDMAKKTVLIDPAEKPNLRIALRWDPKDSDYTRFLYDRSGSVGGAGQGKAQRFFFSLPSKAMKKAMMLRIAVAMPVSAAFGSKEKTEDLKRRLVSKKDSLFSFTPSHDMDLLCFCYDKDGNKIDFISPLADHMINEDLSILHSGDNPDGVSALEDEEILVRLPMIADNLHLMVFVVDNQNHSFDQVGGDQIRAVDTSVEEDYFVHNLSDGCEFGHKQTFIFAMLVRTEDGKWELREISEYVKVNADEDCPLDDSIDDIIRNRYL